MGDWKSTEYLFNWSGLFDYASYTFGFLLNYYINIKFCDDNILMVIKIQRVIRALKISSNDLRRESIFNWFGVIIINAIIIFSIVVIAYIFFPNVNFSDVVYFYFSMTYDMNMLYFTFIIKLLSMTLCAWAENVRKSVNSYKDCYWECMFDVYMDIFTVYESVVSTCGYLVRYLTFSTCTYLTASFRRLRSQSRGIKKVAYVLFPTIIISTPVPHTPIPLTALTWRSKKNNVLFRIPVGLSTALFSFLFSQNLNHGCF